MEFGFMLSSEEHGPRELLHQAQLAEQSGLDRVFISDHFHPWLEEQGESPFVWSVIGGIAATTKLAVTTGVTCPTTRIHPAIIAQAAATSQVLLDGRFRLGVGTGEKLNEHITGTPWPPVSVRFEMLEEALEVIRELWEGKIVTHHGAHYTIHNARIYSLPARPPEILMSGFGPRSTALAARIADGFVTTKPDGDAVKRFRDAGGRGAVIAALKVCFAPTREAGQDMAHRLWRNEELPGQLAQELPMPEHFTQASELVTPEAVGRSIPCGPDPAAYLEAIEKYRAAGVDELYINQIGPAQAEFLTFFERELQPQLTAAV